MKACDNHDCHQTTVSQGLDREGHVNLHNSTCSGGYAVELDRALRWRDTTCSPTAVAMTKPNPPPAPHSGQRNSGSPSSVVPDPRAYITTRTDRPSV